MRGALRRRRPEAFDRRGDGWRRGATPGFATSAARFPAIALAAMALVACSPAKPEAIDAADVAGRWELRTGAETEWFHLERDGSFTAEIRGNGFIATTLSQGPVAELSGRWRIDDRSLTFDVDSSNDGSLVGETHTYEITRLAGDEMVTVDPGGTKTTLLRVR